LPVSVAQSAGHNIPTVYDYLPDQRGFYRQPGTPEKPGRDYVFSSPDPLWSFGFGLGYTTFRYDALKIEKPVIGTNGIARLSFAVTNTGQREGKDVERGDAARGGTGGLRDHGRPRRRGHQTAREVRSANAAALESSNGQTPCDRVKFCLHASEACFPSIHPRILMSEARGAADGKGPWHPS